MNTKSLLLTIVVAFITVWATDFLIHAVWLGSAYKATQHLWRPESEMISKMPFMFAGQFLVAVAFTMIFAACVAEKRCISCSLKYAGCMGVIAAANQLIMYAVAPYPGSLVVKWCVAYVIQAFVLGVIVHKVYKPLPAKPAA